jgi:plastocyanin
MRRGRLAAAGLAAIGLWLAAAFIAGPLPAAAAQQAAVSITGTGCTTLSGFCFSPTSIEVRAGNSVQWTNNTLVPHTATQDGVGGWSTPFVDPGKSASVTFTTPGTFAYHCSIHPDMHGTVVVKSPTFYFAEGYTGPGFAETLSLFTPNTSGSASIDYYTRTGHLPTVTVPLNAGKVTVRDVNADVGPGQDVSAKVTLPGPGVVERTIRFDTGTWHGSTDKVGVADPATEWDFAEGSTLDAFSEYLTLQNPNASAVAVTLNYFTESGATPVKTLGLPANSRTTVEVFKGGTGDVLNCVANGPTANCGVGRGIGGVSAQVKSTMPIIAERPFYVNGYNFGDGVIRDGHDAFGANAPASLWYFAEGTTLAGFKEYLTLQNPGGIDAMVTLNYFTNAGLNPVKTVAVKARSRVTVEVFKGTTSDLMSCVPNGPGANCGVGPGIQGVSIQVRSGVPIVAERPMYMYNDFGSGAVAGAHIVVGATELGTLFGFAAASTLAGENDYLTIQNPGTMVANITITYLTPIGQVVKGFPVAAGTRKTVEVFKTAEGAGPGYSPLGIVVSSDQPVLVEKPTYSSNAATYGATVTMGFAAVSF